MPCYTDPIEESMATMMATRGNLEIGESKTGECMRIARQDRRSQQEGKLARKLLALWRQFRRVNKTSYELAQDFVSFGMNSQAGQDFEVLQSIFTNPEFVASAKALLGRIEKWLVVSTDPSQRGNLSKILKTKVKERYPVRLFLSGYMVYAEDEPTLHQVAGKLIIEFEAIVSTLLRKGSNGKDFSTQLLAFDGAWKSYIKRFLAWKSKDAKILEEDLITDACKQECSMLEGHVSDEGHARTLQSFKDMIFGVSGISGVTRLEQALENIRAKFQAEQIAKFEKEHILNEILHGVDTGGTSAGIKSQVKETMEKAFWDRVEEQFVKEHDVQMIVSLVGELRNLLEGIVPATWKVELCDNLDVKLLSQMLESGNVDYQHMLGVLNYCVELVLKLEAPVNITQIKTAYGALVGNLSSSSLATTQESLERGFVKGLRFALEHVQSLKESISMTKVAMASQVIHEHELEAIKYMQKAFEERYDLRANQQVEEKLRLTSDLFSKAKSRMGMERAEFEAALALLGPVSYERQVPTFPIRTGGKVGGVSIKQQVQLSERQMKKVDWNTNEAAVRFMILDVVCSMEPAVGDTLPETLQLNLARIRNCQNDFQRIGVMATCLLILRQELVSEKLGGHELENVVEEAAKLLDNLLVEADGSVMDKMASLLARICMEKSGKDVKGLMVGILERSFSSESIVFQRVIATVRRSLRDLMMAGNGVQGRALATASLDRICGRFLLQHVLKLAALLDTLATVTCRIHGPWYAVL